MKADALHPHLANPTEAQLGQALQGRPEHLVQVYLALHRLVLEALPGVRTSLDLKDATTGYGARQYGYNGWGLGALSPYTRWVSLFFMRGVELPDPAGILQGAGKSMRHVRLESLEQFQQEKEAIRNLLAAAANRPAAQKPA